MASQNVDKSEIEKFEQVASNWWDKEQEFAPLHHINPCRLNYIQLHSNGLFNKRVLDVGCGGGILTTSMAQEGAKVTGIDAAQQGINVARLQAKLEQLSIDYQCTTVEEFANNQQNRFDIVTCMEMLEHVPDPESVIKSCCRLVKPGGFLFFSTLNKTLRSYLLGILTAEYVLNIVPQGTHDHNKFIKPAALIGAVERNNAKVIDAKGLHYNPLTKSAKLNDDLAVNYIVCAIKL